MYKFGDYVIGQRYNKKYYTGIVVKENDFSIETIDKNMNRYRYDKTKVRRATPDEISIFKKETKHEKILL